MAKSRSQNFNISFIPPKDNSDSFGKSHGYCEKANSVDFCHVRTMERNRHEPDRRESLKGEQKGTKPKERPTAEELKKWKERGRRA